MKLKIVQIGNSKGVRIPRNVLLQYNLKDKVIADPQKDSQLFKPKKLREGWAESFREMAENSDDELISGDFYNSFDEKEWTDE